MEGHKRVLKGVVVSDAMDKTVVVEVSKFKSHPLYLKRVKDSRRYKAHDEHNTCQVGDNVQIQETRPLSKEKTWKVITQS
jgi:small subunit ribosomal protein S17